jgi:hypothetical protein
MSKRRATAKGKKTLWIVTVTGILLLIASAYLAVTITVRHWLRDGAIGRLIGRKTAVILKADAGYLPLSNFGLSVRSGGLLAQGKPPQALVAVIANNISASCSLAKLIQRKWTINELEADHAQAAFGAAAGRLLKNDLPQQPALQPQIETPSVLKVDILETRIRQTDLFWGREEKTVGWLKNVETKYYLSDKDLEILGSGGTFRQTAWPEFKVKNLQAHYAKPKLEIRTADFTLGGGELHITGLLTLGDGGGVTLQAQARHSPIAPFLSGKWSDKAEGVFEGEAKFDQRFGVDGSTFATGFLRCSDGVVHDWPVLEKIALVTRKPEFQRLKISLFRADYKWNGDRLEVTKLHAESKGLACVEGIFQLEKENIRGTFEIGATAEVLDTVPGAREKVFTSAHDGYFWATMHLTGPMKHPREDLKDRLVAAAQEHFAKGLLAPILKPGTGLLELLRDIY